MPMDRDEHGNLLSEFLNPDLDANRKTEILQLLRDDYTTIHKEFEELGVTNEKLKKDNDDLIVSNSKLFRQAGIVGEKKEEDDKKEFSETVTISELEKNAGVI